MFKCLEGSKEVAVRVLVLCVMCAEVLSVIELIVNGANPVDHRIDRVFDEYWWVCWNEWVNINFIVW